MRCLIRKKTIPRQTTLLDGRAFKVVVVFYVVVVQRRMRIHTARKEGGFIIKGVRLFVTHKAQTMKTHTRIILMRICPFDIREREKKSEKTSNISRDIFYVCLFFDTLNIWIHKIVFVSGLIIK